MTIKSDIEIAQEAKPLPITDIADACGMDGAYIEQYGRYKAKIDNRFLKETNRPDGKLVLVTAITPFSPNPLIFQPFTDKTPAAPAAQRSLRPCPLLSVNVIAGCIRSVLAVSPPQML